MEVICDNYGGLERQADFRNVGNFCVVYIKEMGNKGLVSITIRFNLDSKEDYILFDQLRAAIEKAEKFLRP